MEHNKSNRLTIRAILDFSVFDDEVTR